MGQIIQETSQKEPKGQTKIWGPASVIWDQISKIWPQRGQPGNPVTKDRNCSLCEPWWSWRDLQLGISDLHSTFCKS